MGADSSNQTSSSNVAINHTAIDGHWERDGVDGDGDGDPAEEIDNDSEEDEIDEDADAEAEDIARRLNDQLWAEISKAQAEAAAAAVPGHAPPASVPTEPSAISSGLSVPDRRVQEALKTIRIVLKDVANDALARRTLSTTLIPGMPGVSVLDAFNNAVSSGVIPKQVAKPLSHLLVSLARSDALFSSLRHSEESSIQLELGKRQRDELELDACLDGAPLPKRPHSVPVHPVSSIPYALHTHLDSATRAIISALTGPAVPPTGPPPPSLIVSIQLPLHHVFLFAMTAAGPDRKAQQELGGLIQALGVLSGVPISGPGPAAWGLPVTSVHPCTYPGCDKTFARLYSLRTHTRIHSAERPFRCTRCPAAFARNHDLKRHGRMHDDKAWQCTGCAKAFSRRDALTRHRNAAAARHGACATADIAEIYVPRGPAGAEDEMRRTRMWHDASEAEAAAAAGLGGILEDGELPAGVLAAAHATVARLHPVLQACVARALGGAACADNVVDAASSQATLASVLARAQTLLPPIAIPGQSLSSSTVDVASGAPPALAPAAAGSSLHGLSPEQAQMLEQAIASAASAAQLQAEAEAALEEEEESSDDDDGDSGHEEAATT